MSNVVAVERWGYTWETVYDCVRVDGTNYDYTAHTVVFHGGSPIYLVRAPGLHSFRTADLDDARELLRAIYSTDDEVPAHWCKIASGPRLDPTPLTCTCCG